MKPEHWNNKPGGYDALHTSTLFQSSNKYGIPDLLPCDTVPEFLVPYGTEVRRSLASARGGCCHFFLDDYRFESLWNQPLKTLNPIVRQGITLTPDFSLFSDYPKALQIFNVYRNRWLGRYWQENGIQVIPTIAWSDKSSYEFCFEGVPTDGVVAISTVGVLNSEASKRLFLLGFNEMNFRLRPKVILVYGKPFEELNTLVENYNYKKEIVKLKFYDTFWEAKRRRRTDETRGEDI